MATPFNPFAGVTHGQRGGQSTGATGRGRGASSSRGSQFQTRGGPSSFRGRGQRSRARGTGTFANRGRGAGAAAANAGSSHATQQGPASQNANSPFTQLNQTKPVSSPFGPQAAQATQPHRKSPFNGITNGANPNSTRARGSFRGGSRGGAPRHNQWVKPTRKLNASAGQQVPVEDSSILAQYHQRYEQLKIDRAKERQQAIKDGHMADPDQPTSLNQAITPVGTCEGMCPEFESIERIVQKMVDKCEKYLHPSTNTLQNMEWKMLKRFRRSAAGYDEQLPSDIRTPKALLQTTNYLIRHVLNGPEPLALIHKFVWDRTRSVRNDFSVQQVTQEHDVRIAVTCLERIARFHIVSLHLLSSPANEEPFDRHQEREQLNNTMLSLMYYYDDNRGRIDFPNEDEFRAYYIIFSIHDQRPDLEARVQKWPVSLLESPRVRVAMELYTASCNTWQPQGTLDSRRPNAIAQGFYTRFFNIINSPSVSYLMACVAEIYFNYVRQTAIRTIWKGYCRTPISQQHRNEEWTVEELTRVLHFDDDEHTINFLEEQGLELATNDQGQQYLNWGSRHIESVEFSPSSDHAYSETYVESKRSGRSLVAIILGMSIREAARMGMVDQSSLHQRTAALPEDISLDQDDSLFVSSDGNQVSEPVVEMNAAPLESESPAPPVSQLFQNPTPSVSVIPPASTQSVSPPAPPQPASAFQTPPPNPFGSLFSGGSSNGTAPATTPSNGETAPSNPFAAAKTSQTQNPFQTATSPFAFPQPTKTADASSKEDAPAAPAVQPPNPFGIVKPTQPFSQSPSPTPTLPQSSLIFTNGGLSDNNKNQEASKPNPFSSASLGIKPFEAPKQADVDPTKTSTASSASSLFAPPKSPFPSIDAKDTALQSTASTTTFSAQTSNLFNPPASQSTSQPSQLSATIGPGIGSVQDTPSIFSSVKPPSFTGFSKPSLFAPPNESTQGTKSSQSMPTATFDFSKSVPAKSEPMPSLFQPTSTGPSNAPFSSVDSSDKPVAAPKSDTVDESQPSVANESAPTKSHELTAIDKEDSAQDIPKPQAPVSIEPTDTFSREDRAEEPLELPAVSQSQDLVFPVEETEEERQANWREFIRQTAEKQKREAEEQAKSRKRALDETAEREKSRERSSSKVLKTSNSSESSPPSKKYSIAEAYAKVLPTLPCLDRVKALIERKSPAEKETTVAKPHSRQVDEDELLLNAARITAEQLRTGPKIFDPSSEYDPRRSSYSPRASYYSSPFSMSHSPQSHGYKVAHAPDVPEGLGRSMSASERRIRATGAHGLAYKALDFSRVDKRKEKRKYSNSE